jgi:hypothetical protein
MFAAGGLSPVEPAVSRQRGRGPFKRLVLRGATIIDSTGAPPGDPLTSWWKAAGSRCSKGSVLPGLPIEPARRPAAGDFEIDCAGKFLTPGFIDCHAYRRAVSRRKPSDAEGGLRLQVVADAWRHHLPRDRKYQRAVVDASAEEGRRRAPHRCPPDLCLRRVSGHQRQRRDDPYTGSRPRVAGRRQGSGRRRGEVLRGTARDHESRPRSVPASSACEAVAITRSSRWVA